MASSTIASTTSSAAAPKPTHSKGDPGEVLEEWSSIIGIVTAIVGNVLIAMALNVQRYAHTRLHRERLRVRQRARAAMKRAQNSQTAGSYGTVPSETNGHGSGYGSHSLGNGSNYNRRDSESEPLTASFQSNAPTDIDDLESDADPATSTYLKSPYWWLGQILITLGEMGNFLAYGFAPASIVSPLGVVALISNCIIAPVMFHERFRPRDFWGVAIAVAGVVTVVFSANQEETKLDPDDVWKAITTMEFEIYFGITALLIVILMWASGKYGRRTILIDLGLVGLFGGYTALATKGVSSMLSSTLWRAFATPVTYALIVVLLGTAIMQIRYVNKALQRFDSTQVIPIQFVLFTLCVILGSAILYRDFEKTTMRQAFAFVGGCLLTFFGVFLITSGRQSKDGESLDDDDLLSEVDGIEETIGLIGQDEAGMAVESQATEAPNPPSRRSSKISRVSFAETIKPESPQAVPAAPPAPTGLSESAPNSTGMDFHYPRDARVDEPSTTAHSPPRGVRAMSADSGVTGSAVASTASHSNAGTPLVHGPEAPILGSDRPVTPRGSVLSRTASQRHAKTFISPSPLSSTVTTVVKDGFLRDGDNNTLAPTSSFRRIRSSIRASLFFNDDESQGDAGEIGYMAVPASDIHLPRSYGTEDDLALDRRATDDGSRGRLRSISGTITGFFRSKKQKSKNTTFNGDQETDRRPSSLNDEA